MVRLEDGTEYPSAISEEAILTQMENQWNEMQPVLFMNEWVHDMTMVINTCGLCFAIRDGNIMNIAIHLVN